MLEGDMPVDPVQSPLFRRMQENMPGISTGVGYGAYKGSNTLLRGGYMDKPSMFGKRINARRARNFRIMQDGNLSSAQASHFLMGGEGKLGSKTPFFKSSRLNNATLRPRAFGRFHSISVFADTSQEAYTPFGASGFLGNSKFGKSLLEKTGMNLKQDESAFGPGLLSGISAGRRVDVLEAKALKGSSRAAKKLGKIDKQLMNLAKMNSAPIAPVQKFAGGEFGRILPKSLNSGIILPAGQSASGMALSGGVAGEIGSMTGNIGVRGNMYASSMPGAVTKFAGGYVRGSMGFGATGGLSGRALEGAKAAETRFGSAFAKAFGDDGLKIGGQLFKGAEGGAKLLQGSGGKALFRELGTEGLAKLAASGGGRVLASRALGMAIPGLNVLMAAQFAYDIGKMGGEIIKSGINLAKDANRSLQGSIAKPAFGMGYKDTEAAATSRARGVQAIQNSRLNARSALGTEGAMMAAHYG